MEYAKVTEEVSKKIKVHFSKTQNLLAKKIKEGQDLNEFRDDIDANELAQIITVSFIGLISMTKGPMSKFAGLQAAKNLITLLEK